jgi:sugar O-acyltransferase (sialic acid O-acetyltransferase NeuD family)
MGNFVILGAGGHAAMIVELAMLDGSLQHNLFGLISYSPKDVGVKVADATVVADEETFLRQTDKWPVDAFVVGVGSIKGNDPVRAKLFYKFEDAGFTPLSLVHPSAIVSPHAIIGKGTVVMPGAIVNRGSIIGDNVIVNSGSIIEHDVTIGAHSHIAPGAVVCGGTSVGKNCLVGAGASVRQAIKIGDGATIGIGSRLYKNIAQDDTYTG